MNLKELCKTADLKAVLKHVEFLNDRHVNTFEYYVVLLGCSFDRLDIVEHFFPTLGTENKEELIKTYVQTSIIHGCLNTVRYFIDHEKIDISDEDMGFCIKKAYRNGHYDILAYLFEVYGFTNADNAKFGLPEDFNLQPLVKRAL